MTLKTRILLYSSSMMLAALLLMMLVGGNVIHLFSRGDRIDTVRVDDAFLRVSQMMNEYDGGDTGSLIKAVGEYGYQLAVLRDGEAEHSALAPGQEGPFSFASGVHWGRQAGALSTWGVTIIGRSLGDQTIIAIHGSHEPPSAEGMPRLFNAMPPVLISFMSNGLIAVAVILLFSQLITGKVTASITRPLSELSNAARRVEQGDLTRPVEIRGQNEFAEVCETFNHMQQHLLREREKNAAYEKARTDLVSGISHDLRTPLTSVKGYIKGLRDGVASTPEKRERYLNTAYERACDMEKLIARLLDFSRLESGRIPMEFRARDMGEFVLSFAENVAVEYPPGEVEVNAVIQPGGHPVSLDDAQMRRVLINLVDNSVKYAGVRPLKLHISLCSDDEYVYLRFEDNGGGVPPGQLGSIFDEFWRGDASRSSEGSGLGLYIVKYIVEAHGGTVGAENGAGLAIKLTLPRREV